MILQAYRDDEGLQIFTRQLNFLKKHYLAIIKDIIAIYCPQWLERFEG